MAILDERSKTVHSLNSSAAAVWEACEGGATVQRINATVERKLGAPVAADLVSDALAQLQRAGLIDTAGPIPAGTADPARRSMLKRVAMAGAIAIPVVLTLAASEQRAYAQIRTSIPG